MKISEKFLDRFKDGIIPIEGAHILCTICSWEAKKELIVKNQSFISNDKYIDLLAECVNALQEISEKENL